MKKIILFLTLFVSLLVAKAQQLPPYERTRQNQVLEDRATESRFFMGIPKGANPSFPVYVPDSVKCGALYYRTTDSSLYVYNCAAGIWERHKAGVTFAQAKHYADSLHAISTSAIANEATRASGAEVTNSTNISNEITRATGAEATNATNISNEITRALASEATKQAVLGFTPENVANKSTTTTLGTSDTLYPSQKAVKTYVDNAVGGIIIPTYTANNGINLTGNNFSLDSAYAHGLVNPQINTLAGRIAANTTTISGNSGNITTLQGQHTSDYAAIGLKQRTIIPTFTPNSAAIVNGDSVQMILQKLANQAATNAANIAGVPATYVPKTLTSTNIIDNNGNNFEIKDYSTDDKVFFNMYPGAVSATVTNSVNNTSSEFNFGGSYAQWGVANAGNTSISAIYINMGIMQIADGLNNRGLVNQGNYEANFTSKSLTTKRYVDSAITVHAGTSVTAGYGLTGTSTFIADTTIIKSKAGAVTDYNLLNGRITTLQGQHTSDYAAIGLKQRTIIPIFTPNSAAIANGDSVQTILQKLANQASTNATNITTNSTAISGLESKLIITSPKTSAYTAAVNDYVICDATSGAFTVTLPTAPLDGAILAIKMVGQTGTNTITFITGGSDVLNGGAISGSLVQNYQGYIFKYKLSNHTYYVTSTILSLGLLDTRYQASLSGTGVVKSAAGVISYGLSAGDIPGTINATTVSLASLAATVIPGLTLTNPTAATSSVAQNSPAYSLISNVYNTGSSTNSVASWSIYDVPTNGTTPAHALTFQSIINGITGTVLALGTNAANQALFTNANGIAINGTTFNSNGTFITAGIGTNSITSISNNNGMNFGNFTTFSSSTANQIAYSFNPQFSQTSTAGFTVMRIGPYLATTGSNPKWLFEAGTYSAQNGTGTFTQYFGIDYLGNTKVAGAMFLNTTQATISGSTSGTAIFTQPDQGTSFKKVIIYCNSLNGTATYTFPASFTYTPTVVSTNGLASTLVTSISTTGVTVTGSTSTGFLILQGF